MEASEPERNLFSINARFPAQADLVARRPDEMVSAAHSGGGYRPAVWPFKPGDGVPRSAGGWEGSGPECGQGPRRQSVRGSDRFLFGQAGVES